MQKTGAIHVEKGLPVEKKDPATKSTSPENAATQRGSAKTEERKMLNWLRESIVEEVDHSVPSAVVRCFAKPVRRRPLTFRLAESDVQRLKQIQDLTDAASLTEVILDALASYDFIVDQYERGRRMCLTGPDVVDD